MDANGSDSSAQATTFACAQRQGMLFSCGENSETPALTTEQGSRKPASTAPCSATRDRIRASSLYDRRIALLTACGLIAGITPTSTRNTLGDCRDHASSLLVGDMYEQAPIGPEPKAGS